MARFNLLVAGLALTLACIFSSSEAQLEKCHTNILVPHHFLDIDRYRGTWYALKTAPSKPSQVYPLNYTCLSVDVSRTSDENVLDLLEIYTDKETGLKGDALSQAHLDQLELPLPSKWANEATDPATNVTYYSHSVIVAADEDEWSLQYGCRIRDGELYEQMTLFSRQRTLDPKVKKTLETIAFGIGFRPEYFKDIEQTNC